MKLNRQLFLNGGMTGLVSFALTHRTRADSFSYTYEDIQNNLAIIHTTSRDTKKSGCGFIALMDGKPYLVTSQHFILGSDRISFSSPTGRDIKPRSVELSTTSDIVRLALPEGDGFELGEKPTMGDEVTIFGNNGAADSKPSASGVINGLGADIIEVSAEFDETNSGSPVLNRCKEVIGIASYARESNNHIMKKGTRFENRTRRFCHRLDNVQWKAVNWKRFNQSFGKAYFDSSILIDDVITILNSWADGPLDSVNLDSKPEKQVASWLQSHNQIVSKAVDIGKGRREFYEKYSESADRLSTLCQIQARKLRLLEEQRGLTEFMANELNMQAATLEMAAEVIDRYGASTY